MNCPECKTELEIFAKGNKEIYVCPACLSVLIEDVPSARILKYFCKEELLTPIISKFLDESSFESTKKMLKAADNLACPKCKSHTKNYDFDNRLKFFVNRCTQCGAIWMNSMQIPLAALSFLEKSDPDDVNFKKTVDGLYKMMAKKRNVKLKPLDEVIAPYAVIPLMFVGMAPVFPVGDNVMTKSSFYATKAVIIFCVSAFILSAFLPIDPAFSLIAEKVSKGMEWYRLVTYAFLHAGIFHLLGNMWFFWIFGKSVEDRIGWKGYLSLFVISAIFSAALFIATVTNKTIPCVGASGAVSGIIGAYLVFFPKAKIKFNIFWRLFTYKFSTYVPAWWYVLAWIGLNFIYGILQTGRETAGIAYWGHIGGFIAGIAFAELYKNLKRIPSVL